MDADHRQRLNLLVQLADVEATAVRLRVAVAREAYADIREAEQHADGEREQSARQLFDLACPLENVA